MSDSLNKNDGFYVMTTGQVESCQMSGSDHLYCRYSFAFGSDWSFANGVENGMSQIAVASPSPKSQFVWNYPIDITLHSTNVHGWPQIVFSVYGLNWFGRPDVIKGYGSCNVPTVPGRHVRYVRLYTPVSSSYCQQFTAWLTCTPPEFFETKFIVQGKGREVTRVKSNGVIKVVLNVTTKQMTDWGYQNSTERVDPSAQFDKQAYIQAPNDPLGRSVRLRKKKDYDSDDDSFNVSKLNKRKKKKKKRVFDSDSDNDDRYNSRRGVGDFKATQDARDKLAKLKRGDYDDDFTSSSKSKRRLDDGRRFKRSESSRNKDDDGVLNFRNRKS